MVTYIYIYTYILISSVPFLGDIQGVSATGLVGTVSGNVVLGRLCGTVWATRAQSSARGIHSDGFQSIEGNPSLRKLDKQIPIEKQATVQEQSDVMYE